MKLPLIMTPGPTYVSEDVRDALSKPTTNPDLDPDFFEFYKNTTEKIKALLNTENRVLILNGEGILGLEAACASLIEKNDKILCIDNGIFGKGFGDFAKIYGGDVTYFTGDYRKGIDVKELEEFLKVQNDFKVATVVHCETPSGILNPLEEICKLLDSYGIISIVDSVSSIGGETIRVDEWKVGIALGGSQKCLSAPPGLTFLSISEGAWNTIKNRKRPIPGFYCNLSVWDSWYENRWFPYTQPISDIYALDKALENVLEKQDIIEKHRKIANAVRISIEAAGLELYPINSYSNTVTTVLIPEEIEYSDIYDGMINEEIMIAGAFDYLSGKVFRIGHMGENCYEEKLFLTLKALDKVLRSLKVDLKDSLHKTFVNNI